MRWIRGLQLSQASLIGLLALMGCRNNGDGEDTVRGTQLVAEANLTVKDVSSDGTTIAYLDSNDTLFTISVDGGDPIEIANNVDDAEFKNDMLVLFSNEVVAAGTADLQFVLPGETTPSAPIVGVRINSVRASENSQHVYYEIGTQAFLDDTLVVPDTDPGEVRGRFTNDDQFLVVSFNPAALESGIIAVPLNGGAPITIPGCDFGCSSRFQVSNDGQQIVFGSNEAQDTADLTVVSASGQGSQLLSGGASDNGFVIAKDSDTLLFNDDQGVLSKIGLDGSGLDSLGIQNVAEVVEANSTAIVFANAVDPATGFLTLKIAAADGSGETALGSGAIDEGFSTGNSFYMFRDTIAGGAGTLKFTSTQEFSVEEVATLVDKASFQNDNVVVFLDEDGLLQTVDLNKNKPDVYEDFVGKFDVIQSSNQVVFTIPGGAAAGLYIDAL